MTRRSLLAATAAGSTGAAVALGVTLAPPVATEAVAQDSISGIRRSVNALTLNGRTLSAYRRGVAVMKRRPFTDPTSWSYQAAIHGFQGLPPVGMPQDMVRNMTRCEHRTNDNSAPRHFLPWHRLYLHFFERIVRDASGDPDFMLPYWDYSADNGNRLPLAFRWPDDFTNSLYEQARNTFTLDINRGDPLPFSVTTDQAAMMQRKYVSFSDSVEGTPHGTVHVAVGGNGLMSQFHTAALDPIFWLHHCNVDRMWSRWLIDQPGARNPVDDPQWMNANFTFFDETGMQQTASVADTLDPTTLGYTYENNRPFFGGFAPFVVASSAESGVIPETLAASEGVTLSGTRKRVAAEAQGAAAESGSAELFITDISNLESRPVILRMNGISFDEVPGILYEVYVNLPEGTDASPQSPYYAGLLAPFGFDKNKGIVDLDITGVLNRQIEADEFVGGVLTVDFVPAGLPDDGAESGIIIPDLQMDSLEIVRE